MRMKKRAGEKAGGERRGGVCLHDEERCEV